MRTMQQAMIVRTDRGRVRGHPDEGVLAWRGIPYAAAPVGALRFRAPQTAPRWEGVRDCTVFGPICPQADGMPMERSLVQDEDCLNLNVWAPRDCAARRPVLVWIHGGGYFLGSGSQGVYDGAGLAARGAVVVTVNYRLGALGFVDLTSFGSDFESNTGLRDLIAALRWVRTNIAGFGGDPGNVTLFGESSGAGAVTTLMTVPRARGLFHRAIAQSAPATAVYSLRRSASAARGLLTAVGLRESEAGRLREAPAAVLGAASGVLAAQAAEADPGTLAMAPVVDGELIPRPPAAAFRAGAAHRVPLMIGTNRDEASIFRLLRMPMVPSAPRPVYRMVADLLASQPDVGVGTVASVLSGYRDLPRPRGAAAVGQDAAFRMPAVWIAQAHSSRAPTWLYRFDYATAFLRAARVGAGHATEIPYVFDTFGAMRGDPSLLFGGRRGAERVAARIRARWLAFAAGGPPDLPGAVRVPAAWPPYDVRGRRTLLIGRSDDVVIDADRGIRQLWGPDTVAFR